MSNPSFTPPPGADPKATAKAAKAYAKASRKWYQKKRWWTLIVVVVIGIAVAASGGSKSDGPKVVSDDGPSATSSSTTAPGKAADKAPAPGSKSNPIAVGTKVELAGTRYTVTKVETAKTLGKTAYGSGTTAKGTFIVVSLTIENMKNETKIFSDNAAKVIGGNGASYSSDTDGSFAAVMGDQKPLFLEQMQPQLPTSGVIVFDVPDTAVKGSLLELSDLFGKGSAFVALGL